MSDRSYLFVPGDQEAMLERSADRGADALIADLEDAVAPGYRKEARAKVAAWVAGSVPIGPTRWVRVNSDSQADDIEAVAGAGIEGLVVPKVRSAADLEATGEMLSAAEADAGIPRESIGLLPMIETAAALEDLTAIARVPRVARLMIGEMDLGAELGIHFDDWEIWTSVRIQLVVASAAAGLPGPIGPVARDYQDVDGLRTGTIGLRRMGFRGRAAIHPNQVEIINECMAPSPAEVEAAAHLVQRFEAAVGAGRSVAVDDDGRMIDEAIVRGAREVLDAAGRGDVKS